MSPRAHCLCLAFGFVLSVFLSASAAAHDGEGERRARLTPPDGAPFPDARGQVELNREAFVLKVEGLAPAEYQVLLEDGSGTLMPIGAITVRQEEEEDEEHEDGVEHEDGDGDGGDGDGGDGAAVDGEGEHPGDDGDGPEEEETEGLLRLTGADLPFGATSPLDLGGRAIAVADGTGTVVLQGQTPSPLVDEPEEHVGRCPLSRPDPAVDDDAEGQIKLESGEGRVVIKVQISHLAPETVYEVKLTNPADGASESLGMITTNAEGSGQFKLDSAQGDALPFGVGSLAALEGFGVSVTNPEMQVVLAGVVCAARPEDGEDDNDDDDDGEHHEDDGGDPDGADEPCEANLGRPDPAPDPDAAGEVEIEGEELEVEIEHLDPGATYEVFLIERGDAGASASIGHIEAGERGHGELEFEAEEGTPLPFGKTSIAEFVGFGVVVKDAAGVVVLTGSLPAIVCEAEEEDRDGDHEGDGGHDGEEEGGDDHEDGGLEGGGAGLPATDPMFILIGEFDASFLRGDGNRDGTINITDAMTTLLFLFSGGARPYCLDAADVNDDGRVNITDAVGVLNYLFLGGTRPADPGALIPGSDATADKLYCEEQPAG